MRRSSPDKSSDYISNTTHADDDLESLQSYHENDHHHNINNTRGSIMPRDSHASSDPHHRGSSTALLSAGNVNASQHNSTRSTAAAASKNAYSTRNSAAVMASSSAGSLQRSSTNFVPPAATAEEDAAADERRREEIEARRRRQELAEELEGKERKACSLSCICSTVILKPIGAALEYVAEFSFIGILLSYAAITCFVFAMVLLAMQLPTARTITPIYGTNITSENRTTSTTTVLTTSHSPPPLVEQQQQQQQEREADPNVLREEIVLRHGSQDASSSSDAFWRVHNEYLLQEHRAQQRCAAESLSRVSPMLASILSNRMHQQSSGSHHQAADKVNLGASTANLLFRQAVLATAQEEGDSGMQLGAAATTTNSTPAPAANITGYRTTYHTPINFLNATFMSVTAYTASGLSSVNYALWDTWGFILLGVIMTVGDIVLLTMLPAIIRYRALVKERDKLILILEATGAYDFPEDSEQGSDDGYEEENPYHQLDQPSAFAHQEPDNSSIGQLSPSKGHNDDDDGGAGGRGGDNNAAAVSVPMGGELENDLLQPSESQGPMMQGQRSSSYAMEAQESSVMSPTSPGRRHRSGATAARKSDAATARRRATTILYGPVDSPASPTLPPQSPTGGGGGHFDEYNHNQHGSNNSHKHKREHSHHSNDGAVAAGEPQDYERVASGMSSTSHQMTSAAHKKRTSDLEPSAVAVAAKKKKDDAAAATAAAVKKEKEEEKLRREQREEARRIAEKLSFGKRIIYEDGLASIQQQIDICLIIISGVVFYFLACHIVFTLMCMAGGKSWYWGLFHTISAFNNAGMAFSEENMVPLNSDVWLMFTMTLLMPLGNTLFPVFFRFQMSLLHRLVRRITKACGGRYARGIWFGQPLIVWQHSVRLFLRYPRKYFTHMFPKYNTLVLGLLWLTVTTVGFLLFVPEFQEGELFPPDSDGWTRFWIALFQTVSVRTTGFAIMNLDKVSTGHLAWWILAMYTSAYPLIVTVRASANKDMDEENSAQELRNEATSVVGRDLFWLYMAVLLICYGEHAVVSAQQMDVFIRICFEVSSAFGNVGLSLPVPGSPTSYSGAMHPFSLIVMIGVMYCGKHRGLPRTVDEAIAIQVRQYEFSEKELDPDAEEASPAGIAGESEARSLLRQSMRESLKSKASWLSGVEDDARRKQQVEREKDDLLLMSADGTFNQESPALALPTATAMPSGSRAAATAAVLAAGAVAAQASQSRLQQHNEATLSHQEQGSASYSSNLGGTRDGSVPRSPLDGSGKASPAAGGSGGGGAVQNVASGGGFAASPTGGGGYWVDDDGEIIRVDQEELLRRRVRAFYEHYNPARLMYLDRIIDAFAHNPAALLRNLALTYGAEPAHHRAMSAAAAAEVLKAREERSKDMDGGDSAVGGGRSRSQASVASKVRKSNPRFAK